MRLSWEVVRVPWRAPLASARSDHRAPRELVLVRLEDADGAVGHGEAAPLPDYDGVSVTRVIAALERLRDGGTDPLPQARAAVDLATWDLRARQAGVPIWRLLAPGSVPRPVAVNAVIGAHAPLTASAEATGHLTAGFVTLKVKVGTGLAADVARLAAIRAVAGPHTALRVDANGAWGSASTAIGALVQLARFDLELCEEPVHGADALAAVAAETGVPIVADESDGDPGLERERRIDGLCLKIAAAGGISGCLDRARMARRLGYRVHLASTLDGPLGIAAALHAAVAIEPDRPCGLATLGRFAPGGTGVPEPLPIVRGTMAPPTGPGFGDGLLDWYAGLERVS